VSHGFQDYTAFEIPVTVPSGGTGAGSWTLNGVMLGNTTGALKVTDFLHIVPTGGPNPRSSDMLRFKSSDDFGVASYSSIQRTSWGVLRITSNGGLQLDAPLAVAYGGSGTATPSLVAGTAISITGSWPNNTITNTSNYATLADPLPVAHGGTGTATGSIQGTAALTFGAGGSNQNVNLAPSGSGVVTIGNMVEVWLFGDAKPRMRMSATGPTISFGDGVTDPTDVLIRAGFGQLNYQGAVGFGVVQAGDTHPRVLLDTANNQISFGPGNAAVDMFITRGAGPVLGITGGNVGIGTTGPVGTLDLESLGTGDQTLLTLRVPNAAGNNPVLNFSVNNVGTDIPVARVKAVYGAVNDIGMSFWTFNSGGIAERVRLDKDGNVGIGTTTPGSALAVVGLPVYANNAAAVGGGLAAGDFYRTGADPDPVCVVH
jgi:hypothetical protein